MSWRDRRPTVAQLTSPKTWRGGCAALLDLGGVSSTVEAGKEGSTPMLERRRKISEKRQDVEWESRPTCFHCIEQIGEIL